MKKAGKRSKTKYTIKIAEKKNLFIIKLCKNKLLKTYVQIQQPKCTFCRWYGIIGADEGHLEIREKSKLNFHSLHTSGEQKIYD